MAGEAWAVVAGTAIGGVFTLAGTLLTHYLGGRRQARIARRRLTILKKTLKAAPKNGWVHIDVLAQMVGADAATTRALLVEAGARGSMRTEKEMWSLLSRNDLPTPPEG